MQAQSIAEPPVQPMIGSVDNKLTASSTMIQSFPNVRLFLVCFASNPVAHPVGIVSVAKLWLFGGALAGVICGSMGRRDVAANLPGLASFMILVAMAVIAASALWGTGSTREVLTALAKNGKRLTDPIFVFSPIPSRGFLRNRFLCGRAGFFAAQHLGKVLLTFGSLGHFESVWHLVCRHFKLSGPIHHGRRLGSFVLALGCHAKPADLPFAHPPVCG